MTNAERAAQAFGQISGISGPAALEFLETETERLFPRIKRHFYPLPGAADFVRWAHARFPLHLVTNPVWSEGPIQARVRWAGLDPKLFRSLTHSRRSRASKPSEAYYREFLEQEGLRAEDCLLIGNDPINDLRAVRVGIPVCLVNPTRKTRHAQLEIQGARAPAYRATFEELQRALTPI
jgi:FMN phosphatase YigB (HAD superfamily)